MLFRRQQRRLPIVIITPAISTPRRNNYALLNPKSRSDAARVPVHAPVPGKGIPTNIISATNTPRPAFSVSFLPPFAFLKTPCEELPDVFLIGTPYKESSLQTGI